MHDAVFESSVTRITNLSPGFNVVKSAALGGVKAKIAVRKPSS